jgi:hypothetical protein
MNGGGFRHDIAGGNGNLVVTSLQSPNFETGVQGWQVNKDGSVEFNNGTFRGTISGGTLIVSQGSGATFEQIEINGATGVTTWSKYQSPTVVIRQILANGTDLIYADPGNGGSQGALLQSTSPVAGTDGFGNSYLAGFAVYDGSANIQVHVNSAFGAPAIEMPTGAGSEEDHGAQYTIVANKGDVNEYQAMNIYGPGSTYDNTQAGIGLVGSAKNGSSLIAGELLQVVAGVIEVIAFWNANGLFVTANDDGNTYSTGQLWKQATSTDIDSTTPIGITGLSVDVAAASYYVRGRIIGTAASSGTTQPGTIRFNGTATASAVDISVEAVEQTAGETVNVGLTTALNADPSVISGAWPLSSTWSIAFEGIVQFSAAGTFGVEGRETTSSSDASWTATGDSWMIIEPI